MTDTPFQDPALHTSLALTYVEELLSFLADDATSKLWRAKGMGQSTLFPVHFTPYKPQARTDHLTSYHLFLFSSGVLRILPKLLPISYLLRGHNPRVTGQTRTTAHGTIPADLKRLRRVRGWGSARTARTIARTRARHHS